ncbi:DUF397 domain-containing protein [Streptomyces sp. SP18BB07]|uniref:DUF397 domain-containing protein n=1 Tax=Streptomyces sp. SP18BB07 TaxID=3002522 RepID=UPI002E78485C|nr:DUF397 domain-containing protein [Streptomyces sp. SP18BB07]MEE1763809.1 DUF397 domain-containing protein [Streptomyces sp. SP18BB07]
MSPPPTRASPSAWTASAFQAVVVPVRDSKVPHGPALCFDAASWAVFTGESKAGQHHRR